MKPMIIPNYGCASFNTRGEICTGSSKINKNRFCKQCICYYPKKLKDKTKMNQDEQRIINLLVLVYNEYIKLPELHGWEKKEFMNLIHKLEYMIFARPELRLMLDDEE